LAASRLSYVSLLICVTILSFVTNIVLIQYDTNAAFFLPAGRLWELLIGGWVAHYQYKTTTPLSESTSADSKKQPLISPAILILRNNIISALGVALIFMSVFLLNSKINYPGFWALLPTIGTAMVIVAGPNAWFNRIILGHPLAVAIGLISYPLYLWHWPLLSFTHIVIDDRIPTITRILVIIASFVLAWLTYKFVELPMRRQKPFSMPIMAVCILCVLTGGAGLLIYNQSGFETRFETRLRPLVNFNSAQEISYLTDDKCFISEVAQLKRFDDCAKNPDAQNRPSMIIWGDSYAGHLYAGLQARFGGTWDVNQLAAGGCPPIFDTYIPIQPKCPEFSRYIFELLKKNPPKRLILSARWNLYNWKNVERTIEALHKAGIQRIDLVGPAPEWTKNLNQILYKYQRDNSGVVKIPERISFGLDHNINKLDDEMRVFAKEQNVNYVSLLAIFCTDKGCLTRTGDKPAALTTFDMGHFTLDGSLYMGQNYPE
jgi:SGNH domain (fused to AT3 domains)